MSFADYLVLGLITFAAVSAFVSAHRNKGGCKSCGGCPHAEGCSRAVKDRKNPGIDC